MRVASEIGIVREEFFKAKCQPNLLRQRACVEWWIVKNCEEGMKKRATMKTIFDPDGHSNYKQIKIKRECTYLSSKMNWLKVKINHQFSAIFSLKVGA